MSSAEFHTVPSPVDIASGAPRTMFARRAQLHPSAQAKGHDLLASGGHPSCKKLPRGKESKGLQEFSGLNLPIFLAKSNRKHRTGFWTEVFKTAPFDIHMGYISPMELTHQIPNSETTLAKNIDTKSGDVCRSL